LVRPPGGLYSCHHWEGVLKVNSLIPVTRETQKLKINEFPLAEGRDLQPMRRTRMLKKLLLIIDMQNDFIDGSLGTEEAQAIVPRVRNKVTAANAIIFTQDTHGTRLP
jgi:hypothetical protein